MAPAADDDTVNTSPNLPKNNNYSISLLKKSNIKNTPPLMASPRRLLCCKTCKLFKFTVIPVTEHTLVCCYNLLGKVHVKIAQTTYVHCTHDLGFTVVF